MKTYLLPIQAREVVLDDGTIIYKMRDSDSVMYTFNGNYINLDKNVMTITVDPENKLQEIHETYAIAIKSGETQLENKFIIDLFGELGCKFNSIALDGIKDGSDIGMYLYGQIEDGSLYQTGSIESIEKNADEYEIVNVEEVDLSGLIFLVNEQKYFEEMVHEQQKRY